MIFWLNGEYKDSAHAISVADRGFLLGDGVFETLLVEKGVPAFLDEHLERLGAGLEALQIAASAPENIRDIIGGLAEKNQLSDQTASARITVSRGVSGRGLLFATSDAAAPTVLVTISGVALDRQPAPANLIIASYIRAERNISARHKTIGYLDNILARNEAQDASADDAVMLNSAGRVACASVANIFVIDPGGAVMTPSVEEGALPGIIRRQLLAHCLRHRVDIREGEISVADLRGGMIAISNSLIGLRQATLKETTGVDNVVQSEILNRLRTWYEDHLQEDLNRNSSAP